MSLEDMLEDSIPLWQIEDQLTEARQKAQSGNVEGCKEATEKAMLMLNNIDDPVGYLNEMEE